MAMSFAEQELLNRKSELKDKILKCVDSMRAHGMSFTEIAETTGVSRRVLLSIRKHMIHEVSFDLIYILAIGLGITVTISTPRVVRA